MDSLCLVVSIALTLGPMLLLYLFAVRKGRAEPTEANPSTGQMPTDTQSPVWLTFPSLWITLFGLACVVVSFALAYSTSATSNPMKYTGFFWDTLLPIAFFGGAFLAVVGLVSFLVALSRDRF